MAERKGFPLSAKALAGRLALLRSASNSVRTPAYHYFLKIRRLLALLLFLENGGEEGIRTLDTVTREHAFQACALNHSATSPSHTRCVSPVHSTLARTFGARLFYVVSRRLAPASKHWRLKPLKPPLHRHSPLGCGLTEWFISGSGGAGLRHLATSPFSIIYLAHGLSAFLITRQGTGCTLFLPTFL